MTMGLTGGVASSNHRFLILIPLLMLSQSPATSYGSHNQLFKTAIRPGAVLQTNLCTLGALPPAHFLFKVSIWRTSVSISSEVSLLAYLGIRPLPLVMMRRRSSAEENLSEISDGPPKWRPSAVFP